MLSLRYVKSAMLRVIRLWHEDAALLDVDMCHGYNGLERRATKASEAK